MGHATHPSRQAHLLWPLLTACLAAAPAAAHYPWATVVSATPDGEIVVRAGWGHDFPGDGPLATERVTEIVLHRPDGEAIPMAPTGDEGHFAAPAAAAPGTHLVSARQARGYWTRTPHGGVPRPRSEVEDGVRCSYSGNTVKAIAFIGESGAGGAHDRVVGHPLEVVPLDDPSALRPGDTLRVRLLYRDAPYVAKVRLEHAAAGDEEPVTVTAADDGSAALPLDRPGLWLVHAHALSAYPEPERCDVESFHATLTFSLPETP